VLEHKAIQCATARDETGRRKKEPRNQYYRDDFIPSQRSNTRRIATNSRNAGLVNNNVVCYANAIFHIIASCGYLSELLRNTPSIRHAHFNLYYNFASVISSMIRGGNEAVDPVIFTDVFSVHVP
jgi:hypothetical protein